MISPSRMRDEAEAEGEAAEVPREAGRGSGERPPRSAADAVDEEFVCDESDEFAVAGLVVWGPNAHTEKFVQFIYTTARPTDLDGVTYHSFNL